MAAPSNSSLPHTPLQWFKFFGPGAILASLTIGVGELVFSTRAGALFGYKLLWFFALILACKWILVYATARHIALTGAHPFQRWMQLPGPRGWFPLIFILLAIVSFPIWIAFHSGTIGTLLAWLTNTEGSHFAWGMIILGLTTGLTLRGGYKVLERAQLTIVALKLLCVVAAFFFLQPDWLELFSGLFIPSAVAYPDWALNITELQRRPVWVETITYVGVIGGSGYDYLAYVSYLREKGWGRANGPVALDGEVVVIARYPNHPVRQWLRPILFDSILSFVAVMIFAAVFTSLGALILHPQHQIPSGTNLLTLQSQFLTPIFPALKYLYFAGALLAVYGVLYGTIEVAPAIAREFALAFNPDFAARRDRAIRLGSILWVCSGAMIILLYSVTHLDNPPALIAILTPANLFTGVLACGFICLLSMWADFRLPPPLRMPLLLQAANLAAGVAFLMLGIKGYWDAKASYSLPIFAGTILAGLLLAALLGRKRHS